MFRKKSCQSFHCFVASQWHNTNAKIELKSIWSCACFGAVGPSKWHENTKYGIFVEQPTLKYRGKNMKIASVVFNCHVIFFKCLWNVVLVYFTYFRHKESIGSCPKFFTKLKKTIFSLFYGNQTPVMCKKMNFWKF